jgi:hypothetical protein
MHFLLMKSKSSRKKTQSKKPPKFMNYRDYHVILPWLFFVGIVVLFVWIKSEHLFPEDSDENYTYYFAKLAVSGMQPYVNFFWPEMPLHLYFTVGEYLLFGFSIITFKTIAVLTVILTSLFVFLIARHYQDNWTGLLAAAFYLFSFKIFFDAAHPFGIEISSLLISVAYFSYIKKHYFLTGIFFGIAGLNQLGVLAIPLVISVSMAKHKEWQNLRNMALGLLLTFVIPFCLLILEWKTQFLYATITYQLHLLTTEQDWTKIWLLFRYHLPLFIGSFVYYFAHKKRELGVLGFAILAEAIIIISTHFATYEILIIFPYLAILAGYSVYSVQRKRTLRIVIVLLLIIGLFVFARVSLARTSSIRRLPPFQDWPAYIRDHSKANDTLCCFTTVVPLFAMETNMSMYEWAPNTYTLFDLGVIDKKTWIREFLNHPPRFIVIKEGSAFNRDPDFSPILDKCHLQLKEESFSPKFYLLSCRNGTTNIS